MMETLEYLTMFVAHLGVFLIILACVLGFIGLCCFGIYQLVIHFNELMRGE